jgi:hypothetical protein
MQPLVTMHVVRAAPGEVRLYGNFVTECPNTVESLILASLTDRDKGQISYRLGIGSYPPPLGMPPYVAFQLYGIADH